MNIAITEKGKFSYGVRIPNRIFAKILSMIPDSLKSEIITKNGLTMQQVNVDDFFKELNSE